MYGFVVMKLKSSLERHESIKRHFVTLYLFIYRLSPFASLIANQVRLAGYQHQTNELTGSQYQIREILQDAKIGVKGLQDANTWTDIFLKQQANRPDKTARSGNLCENTSPSG